MAGPFSVLLLVFPKALKLTESVKSYKYIYVYM